MGILGGRLGEGKLSEAPLLQDGQEGMTGLHFGGGEFFQSLGGEGQQHLF